MTTIKVEGLERAVQQAGFIMVHSSRVYQVHMAKDNWIAMLSMRGMFNLRDFTDEMLQVGIEQVKHDHPEENLTFNDIVTSFTLHK